MPSSMQEVELSFRWILALCGLPYQQGVFEMNISALHQGCIKFGVVLRYGLLRY